MATSRENQGFFDHVLYDSSMLDKAIDWIKSNLNPEDVFEEKDLMDWADRNDLVKQEEA